ncbi:MAG: hypothetical protein ACJ74H_10395, partial [Thermoanaerobaculia bacterium]
CGSVPRCHSTTPAGRRRGTPALQRRIIFPLIRNLFAFLLLASSAFARGDELRLLAPADGTTLRGGTLAELRWSSSKLPVDAEEWEAFLSIDGGRYYGFRVTPHLDIHLRSFTFVVPNFDTSNARILIRTGDEHRETEFDLGSSFSIIRDPHAPQALPKLQDLERGEAAREGDPAVISWVDGARNGSGVTQQASPTVPAPASEWRAAFRFDHLSAVERNDQCGGIPSLTSKRASAPLRTMCKIEPLPLAADLLLICRRRNI